MPKVPFKNIDRYKIRGGTLNEFEFDENQEAYEEQKSKTRRGNLIPGTPPEKAAKKATKSKKPTKKATNKATKKASKKATKTVAKKGASAKKSTARKGTKKK